MGNPFITKSFHFCAAHQYGHEAWSEEKNTAVFGLDSRNHGHNYILEVTVTGDVNPETGFLIDLEKLKTIVEEKIISVLDHSQIDQDIPWFKNKQPSSENLVIFMWEIISDELKPAGLHKIKLIETPSIYTEYYG